MFSLMQAKRWLRDILDGCFWIIRVRHETPAIEAQNRH
jgi:hypothetical protein